MRRYGWIVCTSVALINDVAREGRGAVYDFTAGAGTQHSAYGNSLTLPPPPPTNTTPTISFSTAAYTAISTSNNTRYSTGRIDGSGSTLAPATRFVFTVNEIRNRITRLDVAWEGAADEDGFQQVWIWNAVTNAYVFLGEQEDVLAPLDGTVSASITTQAANYVDASNRVTIFVNHDDDDVTLFTDYVRLTVVATPCGGSAECDDGVYCNGAEACVASACVLGTPIICNDGTVCTTDSCNEATDSCNHTPVNCADALFCNGVETCDAVLGCRPGTPVNCNDSNACTTDFCNESADSCQHNPVNCSDNLFCNGAETCNPASGCQAGTPVNCDDANACTSDSCNENTNVCNNTPFASPPVPSAPLPADSDIEVGVTASLSWTGGNSNPACPRTFTVYLDTVNPPVSLAAGALTVATFAPGTLVPATTYYWRIVTTDCCTEVSGPVWTFTTLGTPVLAATPGALDFILPTGQSQQVQLTLTNSGNAPTRWTAAEIASNRSARGHMPITPDELVQADAESPAIDWSAPRHPGTLVVGFKSDPARGTSVALARREAVHLARGTVKLRSYQTIPVDVVQVPDDADLRATAEQYAAMPEVAFAEPNYLYHADIIPNDTAFSSLWGMHNTGQTGGITDADIDAPEAWERSTGSHSVVVGVIDTGIDYNHPELAPNMWTNDAERNGTPGADDDANGIIDDVYGARWTSGTGLPTNGNPFDDHYHGTHVAGTIGAVGNNNLGVAGVNWSVRMMALKFLSSAGSGTLADALAAVEYARDKNCHLTSNSWGGGPFSAALKAAIEANGTAGQLFIAAAGNSALNADISPMYPAAYNSPTIVSVAATDHRDLLATFSNYGLTSVDLGAPGVGVLSTSPGNLYRSLNGTSMATPHVSGVAALILAVSPGMPPLTLKQLIMNTVDPIPALANRCVTGGRLNAHRAILFADVVTWLSFSPAAGIVWPGQPVVLTVTANSAGVAPGAAESATIRFSSGDATGPLNLPVTLTVSTCNSNGDCDDGLVCNGAEACGGQGACLPGVPVNCDDGVACTVDACSEPSGTCSHVPNDGLCGNGLVCDGVGTCDPVLGCQTGAPVQCDDGVPCTVDICDEATGGCLFQPDHGLCDNGVFCNGPEFCDVSLGCQPAGFDPCFGLPCDEQTDTCATCASDTDCDDGIACTVDTCDAGAGVCNYQPTDALCYDGLFCNGAEFCDTGLDCQFGEDPCLFIGWCDEAGDACHSYGDGDFESDSDVDLADVAAFQRCFGRPAGAPCLKANLVGTDAMIDQADFDVLSGMLTGP